MLWRNVVSNFLTLAIVLLVVAGGLATWAKNQYTEPGPLAEGICLQVESGARFRDISEELYAKGAISSAYLFRAGADYEEKAGKLKIGSYLIEPYTPMAEIVTQITEGGPSTCGTELNYRIGVNGQQMILRALDPATGKYNETAKFDPKAEDVPEGFADAAGKADVRLRVTLAEGVTSWQVVEALKSADFLSGEVGDIPAEGSLSPDSYEVKRGTKRADLLDQMASRQAMALALAWENRAEGLPYETPEEALVMASIVEKETGVASERAQVASVFVNRLERGMKLQTDPTVIYGVTKGQGALGRGLRQSELRRETPYNTYVIDGLPPTPICNPGTAAIEAALHPAETPYLYFVADGTGGHAFAETLAEHNANVARWRAIEAQQE
ncbi:branched-chain alpha-keto acid dehydrogenase subunit E2 [Rhodobacter sp. TJ_12]|uniref:endolytic transglycosylase MltG n=1 Tax=Rhodobacter sp. TJ_12 TaxID=2029399 RepID=UPI001CBDA211|nr:endolytic transglycosylase MltG [Rhodobacter sp. TJ_12]MBZ4024028.1 branched-chain alpha-keto acid dehydrogenase subunit E2 [Rhodobacter sp. TJ_12]